MRADRAKESVIAATAARLQQLAAGEQPDPSSVQSQNGIAQPKAEHARERNRTSLDATPQQTKAIRWTPGRAKPESQEQIDTFYIVAQEDERGRSMIPRAIAERLEALEAEDPSKVQKLPTSKTGGAPFAAQMIYQVARSQLTEIEAILAGHPEVSMTPVDAVLAPQDKTPSFSDATLKALQGATSSAKTLAIRTVYAALTRKGNSPIPADATVRNAIGDAVFGAVVDYVNLFNAMTLRASRDRNLHLHPERQGTSDSFSGMLGAYAGASSAAIHTLKQAGDPDLLLAARELVLKSAEILEKLDTPRTQALLMQVIPQGAGVILSSMTQRPSAVNKAVEFAIDVAKTRFEQTATALTRRDEERAEGWSHLGHSGSHRNIPGPVNTAHAYKKTPDYPFKDVPTQPLAWLGTQSSGIVREAITDLLLFADAGMPELIARHQAHYVAKEIKDQVAGMERALSGMPEEQRDSIRNSLRAKIEEKAIANYRAYRQLTGQLDIETIVDALARYGFPNESAYSETRAFTEIARLFDDVLAKTRSPEMHRMIADAALSALARYEQSGKTSARTESAANRLRQRLVTPGPDPDVPVLAAAHFAESNGSVNVQRLEDGLRHSNDDVQRFVMSAVGALIGKGQTGELQTLTPALAFLVSDGVSIWTRLEAAEALGKMAPGHREAVEFASRVFAPNVTTVRTGAKWTGAKNDAMRREAAKALAAHGVHAASALPSLRTAVSVAEKAKAASKVLQQRRKNASDTGKKFDLLTDPIALPAVKAALEAGAWRPNEPSRIENQAARVVRYLDDPTVKEFAEIPSYSSDRPNPEGVLAELIEVGEAATRAIAAIAGELKR